MQRWERPGKAAQTRAVEEARRPSVRAVLAAALVACVLGQGCIRLDFDLCEETPRTVPDSDCGGDAGSDAGPADAGPTDAGPADAGPADAGPADAGPTDAGPTDAGPADAGPADAGPTDAGPADAGPADAGGEDAGT